MRFKYDCCCEFIHTKRFIKQSRVWGISLGNDTMTWIWRNAKRWLKKEKGKAVESFEQVETRGEMFAGGSEWGRGVEIDFPAKGDARCDTTQTRGAWPRVYLSHSFYNSSSFCEQITFVYIGPFKIPEKSFDFSSVSAENCENFKELYWSVLP